MFDYSFLVRTGAHYCYLSSGDPATTFAMRGFNSRHAVARRISDEYPEFLHVVILIERTQREKGRADSVGDSLVEEFLALLRYAEEDKQLLSDVSFQALLAGMVGFMWRFEPVEKNAARVVLRPLEVSKEEVKGFDAIALVIMAMWFSDYRGFREDVLREITNISPLGTDWSMRTTPYQRRGTV